MGKETGIVALCAVTPAPSLPPRALARIGVAAIAATFGLTHSLTASAIALQLAAAGHSDMLIGANAATQAVGVLLVAAAVPRLASRFGGRAVVMGALAATATILCLIPLVSDIRIWFLFRLALGAAAESLFVVSETWTNQLSTAGKRGSAMAVYATALSLGFAGGPVIVSVFGGPSAGTYITGAALALATLAMVTLLPLPPSPKAAGGQTIWRSLRLAPLALLATALNAAVETAGITFMPLYAIAAGWDERSAERLISVLLLGAIVLQIPIGWIGDRVSRSRLVRWLAVAAGLGAFAWPFLLGHAVLAYPLLFLWGGVFVGIYTTMMAVVGDRFHGEELVGVFAAMGLSWGAGALVGPAAIGAATGLTPHALPLAVAVSCLMFAVFAFRKDSRTRARDSRAA